jgi:hypothetical protein
VSSKIVLKVGFLERYFESDHLAEKSYWTKMGQKIHCDRAKKSTNENVDKCRKSIQVGSTTTI